MTSTTGTYYAVRLGPDKNPSRGEVIHVSPGSGHGIPDDIMALWKPGEVAVVWGYDKPLRQLSEAGLASVRQKRLRRRLDARVPLLAEVIEEQEHAAKPDFFAGKRDQQPEGRNEGKLTFDEMVALHKARMETLRDTFNAQGYLFARSQRDPGYTILLRRVADEFNVYSFRDGQPVGHRDYDRLEGGSPVQNAYQEFASIDLQLEALPRPAKGIGWATYLEMPK